MASLPRASNPWQARFHSQLDSFALVVLRVDKPDRLFGCSLGQGRQLTQRFKHLPKLVAGVAAEGVLPHSQQTSPLPRGLLSTVAAMIAPCSVNAMGSFLRPPQLEFADCDFRLLNSLHVSTKMKSSGNRSRLRLTCSLADGSPPRNRSQISIKQHLLPKRDRNAVGNCLKGDGWVDSGHGWAAEATTPAWVISRFALRRYRACSGHRIVWLSAYPMRGQRQHPAERSLGQRNEPICRESRGRLWLPTGDTLASRIFRRVAFQHEVDCAGIRYLLYGCEPYFG